VKLNERSWQLIEKLNERSWQAEREKLAAEREKLNERSWQLSEKLNERSLRQTEIFKYRWRRSS
jgi:hypothetical protein